ADRLEEGADGELEGVGRGVGGRRQVGAPGGGEVEGGDDAASGAQGVGPDAPGDPGHLRAGRHIEAGDHAVAVIPGNIARLVGPDVGAAVGKTVTMRVGGAVKLGSTRIGGSGTPRDYAVKIVGVFDEQASQTSFRIPLDDALLAGAENRGLTPDAIRETTGYSGLAVEADDSTNVADIVKAVQELGFSSFSVKQVVEQIGQGFGVV